jgi:hypothetical protein
LLLERISEATGRSKPELLMELDKRTKFLQEIVSSGILLQKDVAEKILSYYNKERENQDTTKPKKKGSSGKNKQKRPPKESEDLDKDNEVQFIPTDIDSALDLSELPNLQKTLSGGDNDESIPLEEVEPTHG